MSRTVRLDKAILESRCINRWSGSCGDGEKWGGCIYRVLVRLVSTLGRPYLHPNRDKRNPQRPLGMHTSTHSNDINLLSFNTSKPQLLLSGAADGLLSITDVLEMDEDEAVIHMGNWGCSIARAGWMSTSSRGIASSLEPAIWSASDMETMALWSEEVVWGQFFLFRAHVSFVARPCPRVWGCEKCRIAVVGDRLHYRGRVEGDRHCEPMGRCRVDDVVW